MKKPFLAICSVLLVIASLFGFYAAGMGVKDCLDIKAYKEADAEEASVVEELEKAIVMLKENEQTYLEGVNTYVSGLEEYAAGQQKLKDGEKTLAAGYASYYEGLAAYEAGKKAYAEGQQQYAEGKALLDENTAAYEEGKATLSKIQPLMPLIDTYVALRDGVIQYMPGFSGAQAWAADMIRPMAADLGLELPEDDNNILGYIQNMVAEGKAQLKEYEDGLAQLLAAEKQLNDAAGQLTDAEYQLAAGRNDLASGETELAQGKIDLENGAKQLEDGKAQLEVFEDGMAQVDGYTMTCYKNEPIYRFDGELAVGGPEQRLGENFTWDKLDADGNTVYINGHKYLDLDKCLVVCASFRDSVDEHVADVTHELYCRLALYIVLALAGLCGLIGGIFGIAAAIGKNGKGIKGATGLGVAATVLMLGGNVFGMVTRYTGYTYPLRWTDAAGNDVFQYSGTLQLEALIVLAVVALVFTLTAAAVIDRLEKTVTQ